MSKTLIFPYWNTSVVSCTRCNQKSLISYFLYCMTAMFSIIEHKGICVVECSFKSKTLFRSSKTEEERDNELNSLQNNRVYFTYVFS